MADPAFFFSSEQSSRSWSIQKCPFSVHLKLTYEWDFGVNNHHLEVQLRPSIPPRRLFSFNSPSSVLSYNPRRNDPAHSCHLRHPSLRRWQEDTRVCHARGFSRAFWQLRWYLRAAESCIHCFSCHHASACDTKATSRCWMLACLLFFWAFDFKNSIWLACSQGCYSALQTASAASADKPATAARFIQILHYLAF